MPSAEGMPLRPSQVNRCRRSQPHASPCAYRSIASELATARVAALRGDNTQAVRALDNAMTVERVAEGQPLEGPSAWRRYIFSLRAGTQRANGDQAAARTNAQAAIEQFESTVPADHRWRADALALLR